MFCTICSGGTNVNLCEFCSFPFCEDCMQNQHECDKIQSTATNTTNSTHSTSTPASNNSSTDSSTNSPTNRRLRAAQIHYRDKQKNKWSPVELGPYSKSRLNCSGRNCCEQNNGKFVKGSIQGVQVTEKGPTTRRNETPIREAFTTSKGAGDEIQKQQTEQANKKSRGLTNLPAWVTGAGVTIPHPSDSTATSSLAQSIINETYVAAETRCIHCCQTTEAWPSGRPPFSETNNSLGRFGCCRVHAGYYYDRNRTGTILRDDGPPCILLEEWKKSLCLKCRSLPHEAAKKCGTERCDKHCGKSNRKQLSLPRWPQPLELPQLLPIQNDDLIRQSIRSDSKSGYFGVLANMSIKIDHKITRNGKGKMVKYTSFLDAAIAHDKICLNTMRLQGFTSVDNELIQNKMVLIRNKMERLDLYRLNFTNSSAVADPVSAAGESIAVLLEKVYAPDSVPVLPGTAVEHCNVVTGECWQLPTPRRTKRDYQGPGQSRTINICQGSSKCDQEDRLGKWTCIDGASLCYSCLQDQDLALWKIKFGCATEDCQEVRSTKDLFCGDGEFCYKCLGSTGGRNQEEMKFCLKLVDEFCGMKGNDKDNKVRDAMNRIAATNMYPFWNCQNVRLEDAKIIFNVMKNHIEPALLINRPDLVIARRLYFMLDLNWNKIAEICLRCKHDACHTQKYLVAGSDLGMTSRPFTHHSNYETIPVDYYDFTSQRYREIVNQLLIIRSMTRRMLILTCNCVETIRLKELQQKMISSNLLTFVRFEHTESFGWKYEKKNKEKVIELFNEYEKWWVNANETDGFVDDALKLFGRGGGSKGGSNTSSGDGSKGGGT